MPRRALISVSDKSGLESFVRELHQLGFEIVSTGGTARFLRDQGIPVVDVSEYTGFPEIMDGRVKTLHPKVHGAILGRPDLPADAAAIAAHGIVPFELVVVNLYPFEQTVARPGVTHDEAVEQIDIGGPSMVRSAAKNHAYVGIVTSPDQYGPVLEALRGGSLGLPLRRRLMQAAFEITARYDAAIAKHFAGTARTAAEVDVISEAAPAKRLELAFELRQALRYGENPHQSAAWYVEPNAPRNSLTAAEQVHGKELSYNNLLDLDAALAIVREFAEPAATVLKHNNPCGCAIADTLADAFEKAYDGDPVSAFGSILGFNRAVDATTADRLCQPNRFIEAVIAPGFDPEALEILTTRPKWKASVRLLRVPGLLEGAGGAAEYRRVSGGLLVQDRDDQPDPVDEFQVVTERAPTESERRDLEFAWKVCKHVKSNAIVFAKAGMVLGVGAGQMSRLDSARIAADKSGDRGRGAVAASDAFFPFRDGVDQAAEAGVTALIQPGGSVRDAEVIAACNERGLAMIFTGRRHFRH
ncbi:MAG: bifunctional phosphoribosylaminoimidazolecarboxamide formyltransferase/IMP cyclohydrolase [Planctomyces sp.]|nr:bifunctional phosphoribosylaminoimidazolecarboxamide formyltransferase/IMP cyclohydrolase [Planctomyces sp.]